jgi:hypothetical protein
MSILRSYPFSYTYPRPAPAPIMAHDENYELTATAAVDELGHESGDRIKALNDAPEIHTDSRGNTHRLEVVHLVKI